MGANINSGILRRLRLKRASLRIGIGCVATLAAAALISAQSTNSLQLQPFVVDHRGAQARPSPVDVSFLLDPPAGKHGFIHAAGGHLVDGSGQRVRLWGVNLTEWSPGSTMIPSKADAPMWAATLARYGVNCVRLQFLDLPAPRGLIAAEPQRHARLRSRTARPRRFLPRGTREAGDLYRFQFAGRPSLQGGRRRYGCGQAA